MKKRLFQTLVLVILFADIAIANRNLVYYAPHRLYEVMPQIVSNMKTLAKDTGPFRIYRTPMEYTDQYAKDDVNLNRYEKQRLWEKNTLKKNIGTVYHLSYFDGYETFEIREYINFFDALKKYPEKLFSLLNVRYLIVPENDKSFSASPSNKPLLLWKKERIKILENKNCFERAFIVFDAAYFNNKEDVLKTISKKDFDFAATVAIESKIPCQPTAGIGEFPHPPGSDDCDIVVHEPDYVQINATVPQDAYLVISDTYYPGWEGYVDGKKEPVLKANYILRALFVPKGSHTIEFRYEQPTSFRIGAAVTALTALLALSLLLYRKKDIQYRR